MGTIQTQTKRNTTMQAITLYGQSYVNNDNDLVDTLFDTKGTANGTYKVYKNRVELTHTSGEVMAVVAVRDGIVLSTKTDGRFMFSTSSLTDQLFSVPKGYMTTREQARELLNTLSVK